MKYALLSGCRCRSCDKQHKVAVPISSHQHASFTFTCPETKQMTYVHRLPAEVFATSPIVPEGYEKATEYAE